MGFWTIIGFVLLAGWFKYDFKKECVAEAKKQLKNEEKAYEEPTPTSWSNF